MWHTVKLVVRDAMQMNLTEKALYLKELSKYMRAVCEGYIDEITAYALLHMEHT